jgi:hypothetical protein
VRVWERVHLSQNSLFLLRQGGEATLSEEEILSWSAASSANLPLSRRPHSAWHAFGE